MPQAGERLALGGSPANKVENSVSAFALAEALHVLNNGVAIPGNLVDGKR